MTLKHPFQIVLANEAGTHLFTSVKNEISVFGLTGESKGKLLGSWIDPIDNLQPLQKQQQEKIKVLEKNATNGEPIKVPKIPTPGPGAPPIYNYIRSLFLSHHDKYLIGISDSDKSVIIFEIVEDDNENCLKFIKRQPFPKRPSSISIDEDDDTIIVADKFGDVYTMDIIGLEVVDEKKLNPILGHVSMLSEVLITKYNGKKFIITGDRDEHIRITNYPKTYVIKDWLFGAEHKEFISILTIPSLNPSLLISGGGDDFISLWNWYESKFITKIDIKNLIQQFLTDSHLPPERFLTEESEREMSISKLLMLNHNDHQYIIILCENTPALLLFELIDSSSFKYIQTFTTNHSIIDITVIENTNTIIASVDNDQDENTKLLQYYHLKEGKLFDASISNDDVIERISNLNQCQVESRDDYYPLYTINTLRKRSEH
ncbi:WDR repeat protein putative transfer RNA methyltransferase [Scheffersomyces coipomensis]|uniref:WDR repeat protein putative transfer RNA methyltransferase n=1 Tax=Scheffersomyces coipomensis TaxID=1788519 RepID=UPI00315D7A9B